VRSRFEEGLDPNPGNDMPLEPASFLVQTAAAFPRREAMVHGERRFTFAQLLDRSVRLASALSQRGIGKGDVVSLMAANTPEALEAHYGVNMVGAVLNPLNIRLDAAGIGFILDHAQTAVLLTDTEFAPVIADALDRCEVDPLVIDIADPEFGGPHRTLGQIDYETLLGEGDPSFDWPGVDHERQAICLSYTSGTTGDPKGVVSNARQIYLNSMGQVAMWPIPRHPRYLWTLPMFHAVGWCMPYAMVLMAGVQIGLRKVDPAEIFHLLSAEGVTHMCAAPIVLNALINAPGEVRPDGPVDVAVLTAGSAPPPAVLFGAEALGFKVLHVYGLTEVAGPQTYSPDQTEWEGLPAKELARLRARQGVPMGTLQGGIIVADPDTCEPVPRDGETVGELLMRTNTLMSGYLANPAATEAAFKGGWFHSGDLGVWHEDGYVEIKDRSKDIIISGGENISSVEVEAVLYDHPEILEAAVVAAPHEKWGETPCAFVARQDGSELDERSVIAWCRDHLAHYKCPTKVVFGELPKTSTGKVQKFVLRAQITPPS
jgi:fatty-acyl-CoA synthase